MRLPNIAKFLFAALKRQNPPRTFAKREDKPPPKGTFMPAIVETLQIGPFGNPDTNTSTRTGPSLRKNARLEEARDICFEIQDGRDLMFIASNTDDLMAYAVGSMIAKLDGKHLTRPSCDTFAALGETFAKERFLGENAYRFSRRTVFDTLTANGLVTQGLSIREAKHAGTLPTIAEISRIIENYRKVNLEQIQSPARSRSIVDARFVAIWVMRYVCGHSLTYIGEQLGKRDHTSILNGVNRIRAIRAADVAMRKQIDDICDEADMLALRRHHGILLKQSVIRRVI
jgi:hypothetical protein